jgi:hypothetical protein
VLNAHLTNLEVNQAVLAGEIAHQPGLLGRVDVLVRAEMVGHQDYLIRIKDMVAAQPSEFPYGDRRSDIIGQNNVGPYIEEIPGADPGFTAVRSKYLLC